MCICKTYAYRMVSRAKDTHTTNRVVRIPDADWNELGEQVGERHRAQVIRDYIAWRLHRPGAKRPERPAKKDRAMITVRDIHTDETATIDRSDFAATVTPWFPEAPVEVTDAIAEVQEQLNRGEFIAGSAESSLGLVIE